MERFDDEYHRQRRNQKINDICDAIIGILLIALLIWVLWPKASNAAVWDRSLGYNSIFEIKPLAQEQSYDDQKLIDLWKHNVKIDYTVKLLTMNEAIWEFLTTDMGLSDECAAGIFGNMMVECGNRSFDLHPYVYSPGGSYYGLCQWNTFGHHSSIAGGTLEEQLLYLRDTISSEMGESNYNRFISASTPEEAANIFGQWYERCRRPYGRQSEARAAYEEFGGE